MFNLVINFIHQTRPILNLDTLLDKIGALGDIVQQHGIQIEGGGVFERDKAILGSLATFQKGILEGFVSLSLTLFHVCFLSAQCCS